MGGFLGGDGQSQIGAGFNVHSFQIVTQLGEKTNNIWGQSLTENIPKKTGPTKQLRHVLSYFDRPISNYPQFTQVTKCLHLFLPRSQERLLVSWAVVSNNQIVLLIPCYKLSKF